MPSKFQKEGVNPKEGNPRVHEVEWVEESQVHTFHGGTKTESQEVAMSAYDFDILS